MTDYTIKQKVNYAKTILCTTAVPCAEIAAALNYSSAQHFSGNFKKQTGMTPAEYRKKFSRVLPQRDPDGTVY